MTDEKLQREVIHQVALLHQEGFETILVHGGGPYIKRFLEFGQIESTFISGLRYTSEEAIPYVEAALRGYVNGQLVGLALKENIKAIGLSGKDGQSVLCIPIKAKTVDGEKDLGRVGAVTQVNAALYEYLIKTGYLIILNPIAIDKAGNEFNINADSFAGAIAAALEVDHFLVLSNIDGLMQDPDKPETFIAETSKKEIETDPEIKISAGMMPKLDGCFKAAESGVGNVRIINGEKPELIRKAVEKQSVGTRIL